jgi:nonsense-mediated mRNA decay protein 3
MALYKAQQQQDPNAMEVEDSDADDADDEGLAIPMEQLLDDFEDMTMAE